MLFADLVGFTPAAHDLPPEEIVGFLDSLVRTFDALAEQHGVEKIKTVGDSYMAAAGFDGRAREGAVAIGRFALAMLRGECRARAARERQARTAHRHPLRTRDRRRDRRHALFLRRVGCRRERRLAHGIARRPGRIQVSEAFRDADAQALSRSRSAALLAIKGIGETRTYFLTARNANKKGGLAAAPFEMSR